MIHDVINVLLTVFLFQQLYVYINKTEENQINQLQKENEYYKMFKPIFRKFKDYYDYFKTEDNKKKNTSEFKRIITKYI